MSRFISSAPDSTYSWTRLAASLVVGTTINVASWSFIVILPTVQADLGLDRAGASMPYTATMFGFAAGTIAMGRVADRLGMVTPILISVGLLLASYGIVSVAPNVWVLTLAQFFIGIGASSGFAPIIADLSHWFNRHRGLAVVVAATGSYLAGAVWPPIIQHFVETSGWRATNLWLGVVVLVIVVPMIGLFARRPTRETMASAHAASEAARADLGLSPNVLQALLTLAGFSCCVAMAMPQVHIVAYCGDLGFGVARGAQMLALMMGLGAISRIGSGFLADRIGGSSVLVIGSFMQAVALFLYLFFDGLVSLFIVSAMFGLFQGGIVPMYAVLVRQFLPPHQAGSRIGIVMTATILGMAFGGYLSGLIFDYTASYRLAFLNGLLWNMVNLALVGWIWMRVRAQPQPA